MVQVNECFPSDLKRWRGLKGLSQTRAATEIGVPVVTFRQWEQGRRFLVLVDAVALAYGRILADLGAGVASPVQPGAEPRAAVSE